MSYIPKISVGVENGLPTATLTIKNAEVSGKPPPEFARGILLTHM
jgi:hypothetical protein